jgi:hypothetical protein
MTLLTLACNDENEADVVLEGRRIHFDVTEFEVSGTNSMTSMEGVKFDIDNRDNEQHELILVRKLDLDPAKLPLGVDGRVDERKINIADRIDAFDGPGLYESAFPLVQPGDYIVICNLLSADGRSHYQAGMWFELTFTDREVKELRPWQRE